MIVFKRIIKAGFVNFKRSGFISFAAMIVMTITLSFITGIILLQAVLSYSLTEIENKVDVTIYFNVGASEDKILALKSKIENLPEVREVTYVSAKEALKIFRERHSNDYPTIQALDEISQNPLGAYLNVKAKDITQYENIANFMKSDNALVLGVAPIIDKINYYQNKNVIEKLHNITTGAEKLGFIVTLLLIIIALIITFNTIRLTIFIAKEEINVMRLVGASKMRVRGPFMVEGAIYGLVATVLTLLIFWPVTAWFGRNMTSFLGINVYDYYFTNLLSIGGIVLLSGIFLGMVASFLAVKKYLK